MTLVVLKKEKEYVVKKIPLSQKDLIARRSMIDMMNNGAKFDKSIWTKEDDGYYYKITLKHKNKTYVFRSKLPLHPNNNYR